MNLTSIETAALISLVIKALEYPDITERNKLGLETVLHKLEFAINYDLGLYLRKDEVKQIDEIVSQADYILQEYGKCQGDMIHIEQYDTLKKKASPLLSTISYFFLSMDAKYEFYDKKLKSLLIKIALEIKGRGDAKSLTEAEKLALVDPRYELAISNAEEYKKQMAKLQSRYRALDKVYNGLVQSISSGRVGMVRESYQQ